MDGPLSPLEWSAIVFMSAAGAWMYFALRTYDGHWTKLVGMYVPAVAFGAIAGPTLCEYYKIPSFYQYMLASFASALLAMPINRAAISVTESEAVNWIKERIFGPAATSAADKRKHQDAAGDGGDSDDSKHDA
jgi:ribose/xylose/arabinose/galactoside ABC-type transport system permease subunit